MPASINVIVAITERIDRRLIPQIPCPLVQPEPKRVPKPTKRPAMIKLNGAALILISGCTNNP